MKEIVRSPQENVAWTHRRLVGFAARLQSGLARPSEFTCIFIKSWYAKQSMHWFMRMACHAVRRKYALAGHAGVVAALDEVLDWQNLYLSQAHPNRGDRAPGRQLFQGTKRLHAHATRWRCADVDLFACNSFGYALTDWLFQQPDLRYRVHVHSAQRLQFMVACWAAYAEHGLTPQTANFGLEAFPLTAGLRPDIA